MKKAYLFFLLLLSGNLLIANSFTDLHDQTKSYTHPSFVIYNNEPYRSLKSVPANIEITNTEYWSNLKTEATQQTIPSGSETPPTNIDTEELVNQSPGTNNTPLSPPSFTSSTTVTIAENSTGTAYTAIATGADSYSILGMIPPCLR